MKKLLILLSTFLGMILFYGCSIKDQFVDEPKLSLMDGILTEQKNTDKENGTHFLTIQTNEKIPLRSVSINLSSNEYLNNKVQVTGFKNEKDEVFEVSGILVLEILSNKTKQHKLIDYKNTEEGFQLKYYDDWSVNNEKNGDIVFTAPLNEGAKTNASIVIQQYPFQYEPKTLENGSTDTALMSYYDQTTGNKIDKSMIQKIGVDKIDAVKMVSGSGIDYTLYRSGLIYQIMFTPGNPANSEDEKIFNQMMAEFQFIAFTNNENSNNETVDVDADTNGLPKLTMELSSFESLPYKFSGKYPAKWYYAGVKGNKNDILHHYGFSNEAVTDDNEIITLDILAESIPNGEKLSISGKELIKVESDKIYTVYTTVSGQNYKISGPKEYKDLIVVMASSISPTPKIN